MSLYIGIDPGVNGGIAAVDALLRVVRAERMPRSNAELLEVLRWLVGYDWERYALLERARPSRMMGVTNAFSYGLDFGGLQMGLTATETPFEEVVPQVWMRSMQCLTKGDKNVTKALAAQLFPSVKVTHAIADALLIATYCRRVNNHQSPRG